MNDHVLGVKLLEISVGKVTPFELSVPTFWESNYLKLVLERSPLLNCTHVLGVKLLAISVGKVTPFELSVPTFWGEILLAISVGKVTPSELYPRFGRQTT